MKQSFRTEILSLVESESDLKSDVEALPGEVRRNYYEVCRQPSFTNADFWRLLNREPLALPLLLLQGRLTQQPLAYHVQGDVNGIDDKYSDLVTFQDPRRGGLNMPQALDQNQLLERKAFHLPAPGPELIARLSASQVDELRTTAKRTIWDVYRRSQLGLITKVEDVWQRQLEVYWNVISTSLSLWFPQEMQTPTQLFAIIDRVPLAVDVLANPATTMYYLSGAFLDARGRILRKPAQTVDNAVEKMVTQVFFVPDPAVAGAMSAHGDRGKPYQWSKALTLRR